MIIGPNHRLANQDLRFGAVSPKRQGMSDTPKVEIYTGAACGYCMQALRLLDSKNITYEQIDTSMNSALRADMRSRSGGRHTVPQIFIGNEHIGDCEELFRLENAGHLDRLLRVS